MVGQTELAIDEVIQSDGVSAEGVGRRERSRPIGAVLVYLFGPQGARGAAMPRRRGEGGEGEVPTFSIPPVYSMILANRLVVMELKKILRKKYFLFYF